MKTRTLTLTFLAVCASLFFSCTPKNKGLGEVNTLLDSLSQRYAPDGRIAVFEVRVEQQGSAFVVKGDVEDQRAKEESVEAIRKATGGTVIDSVKLLPDPELGENTFGIVAVSVGNVRTKPGHPNELSTQVLMGTVVKLLKKQGGWYFVQMPDKYLGWLEASALRATTAEGVDAWRSATKMIVTNYFALVRSEPRMDALPVSDGVVGMLVKFLARKGTWDQVELPDGRRGFIETSNVEDYQKWRQTRRLTADNIEKTAKMFIGVPYLWGGTSAKGMDCSGFTKTVFRLNGLELNRDADQQALMGEPVDPGRDFENLRKGDLLFFGRKATAERTERITHVGIYLGKQEFIHSPGGAGVKLNSFDPSAPNYSESHRRNFVRSRRVIGVEEVSELSKKKF